MAVSYFNLDIHLSAGSGDQDVAAGVSPSEVQVQASDVRGRKVTLRWDGTGVGDILSHFTFVNYTGGVVDDSWTSGDFETIEALLDTWWTNVKDNYDDDLHWRGGRWHRIGQGVGTPNPQVREFIRDVAGSSSAGNLPGQVSSTISFHTALRRRWGRTYLPAPHLNTLQLNGRFTSTFLNDVIAATDTLLAGAAAADFKPVVWSQVQQAFYGVRTIVMDDVPDIIRRRRIDTAGSHVTRPT